MASGRVSHPAGASYECAYRIFGLGEAAGRWGGATSAATAGAKIINGSVKRKYAKNLPSLSLVVRFRACFLLT